MVWPRFFPFSACPAHPLSLDSHTTPPYYPPPKKTQLNSELDKLLGKPTRTIRDLERGSYIEERLQVIGKEASQLKLRLKRGKSELLSAHA